MVTFCGSSMSRFPLCTYSTRSASQRSMAALKPSKVALGCTSILRRSLMFDRGFQGSYTWFSLLQASSPHFFLALNTTSYGIPDVSDTRATCKCPSILRRSVKVLAFCWTSESKMVVSPFSFAQSKACCPASGYCDTNHDSNLYAQLFHARFASSWLPFSTSGLPTPFTSTTLDFFERVSSAVICAVALACRNWDCSRRPLSSNSNLCCESWAICCIPACMVCSICPKTTSAPPPCAVGLVGADITPTASWEILVGRPQRCGRCVATSSPGTACVPDGPSWSGRELKQLCASGAPSTSLHTSALGSSPGAPLPCSGLLGSVS